MTYARTHLLLGAATLALFAFACARAPLQNEDSVLYVVLAERIAAQGLASGFELFDRPFYSALVAGLHLLTGLPALGAARALNAACAVLLVCAFAEFCRLLYREDRLLPWAGLLLLAHPKLVNCFALLVRDLGYWALLVLSFCLLLRHLADGRRRWLPAWAGCILGAAVFKPEALVWGLLVPPGMLLVHGWPLQQRARAAALAFAGVAVPVAVAAALLGGLPAHAIPEPLLLPRTLVATVIEGFADAARRYADGVLDPFSRHVAALSLAGGLLVILLAKMLNALGPLQLLALWAGRGAVPRLQQPERLGFLLQLAPALLLPAVFVAYRQFLDTRYVMLVTLLLLALVVPRVRALAAQLRGRVGDRRLPVLALLVLVFGTDLWLGLDRPKPYMLECVAWMRTGLPAGTRLFSNDVQLASASGARWEWNEAHNAEQLLAQGWRPQDAEVWIIHERRDRATLPDLQRGTARRLSEVRRFEGGKGARIRVLRVGPGP
jgi:hypothetical protein